MGAATTFKSACLAFFVAGTCMGCVGGSSPPTDPVAPDASSTTVGAFGDDAGVEMTPFVAVKGELDITCSSNDMCHGMGAGINFVITPLHEFDDMINVASTERPDLLRVKPGDPMQSYLYLKVWCDGGIDGGCMPFGQARTPQLTRIAQAFHDWIEAGAATQ